MDNGFIGNLRQSGMGALSQRNIYAPRTTSAPSAPSVTEKVSVQASNASTPKTKVTKIYDDGGVDIQTTIKEAEPYNLSNGNYGRAEYSYTHIPGKAIKRSVYSAYNGKYTPSEAKAVMDKDVFKNIYNNVGASLEYTDDQKAAITTLVDTILDKKYAGKKGPSGSEFDPTMERLSETVRNRQSNGGETTTLTAEETVEGPAGAPQEGPGTIGAPNDNSGVVEYTYAPGDNFGNVLIKMGLSDGRNLWGPNGDVAYYTQQLNNQGIYGNIPVGTKIRLRKRA